MECDYTTSEEDMLLALDQLAQTIEVMGAVIDRLKRQVENQAIDRSLAETANSPRAEIVRLH